MSADDLLATDDLHTVLLALHTPQTRWQPHPDAEWSTEDREEAAEDEEGEPTSFAVCAHCGDLEMYQAGDSADYFEALWPCPTARLAGVED